MDDRILTADDIAVIEEFTTHAIRDEEDLWQRLQDTGARLAETVWRLSLKPIGDYEREFSEDAIKEWETLQADIENESTRMNQRLEDAVETVEIDPPPNLTDFVHALADAARHTARTYEHSTKEELGDDVRWTVIEAFQEMKGEQLMPFEREFRHAYKNNPEFRAAIDQQRERESRGESSF